MMGSLFEITHAVESLPLHKVPEGEEEPAAVSACRAHDQQHLDNMKGPGSLTDWHRTPGQYITVMG